MGSEDERTNSQELGLQYWNYEHQFREYVLLLGRKGKEALESASNFPREIEIGDEWHELIERMRSETSKDGNERYSIVGSKEPGDIYFSKILVTGSADEVPASLLDAAMVTATEENNLWGVPGELHSHSDDSPFSPKDFYRFLNDFHEPPILLSGLVTAKENLFVFKTRETFPVTPLDVWPKSFPAVFEKYWLEKAGYRFNDDRTQVIQIGESGDRWMVNRGIAEAHQLALYRGEPLKNLKRIYPDISKNRD